MSRTLQGGLLRGAALALLLVPLAVAGPQRRPWNDVSASDQFPPERLLDIEEYRIAVDLDFQRREIRGTVQVDGKALRPGVSRVALHAHELDIASVTGGDGEPLEFHQRGDLLEIDLLRPLDRGESTTFTLQYSATPRRGLYFLGPDEHHPRRPVQAWTQGEALDTRDWMPVFDAPSERARTVLSVTVPEEMQVVSNGRLVRTEDGPGAGKRTFLWEMDFPHVAYLTSLVAGTFEEIRQEWRGIPVTYLVPPGRRDAGLRSFGRTPDMMEFFSSYIGVPYPYAKYSQVAVSDFIYGGMENISATTQTVDTLHEARNHLDFPSEGLVAHELAHQWWGDYVTCNTWAHAWLNEGFATYFDALFTEHDLGSDEFHWKMRGFRDRYIEEDARWRRSLVMYRYTDPMDLFDPVLYQKGAWVVHMIRMRLGEQSFRHAIRQYATDHAGQSVETDDLRRSIARATGDDLTRFLRQWALGEGHPDLEVRHEWQRSNDMLRLEIEQRGAASGESGTFHFPLTVEIQDVQGVRRHRLEVDAPKEVFHLPAEREPRLVLVDPDEHLLKTLNHHKARSEWLRQLREAPRAIQRIDAARALGEGEDHPGVIQALAERLSRAPFHGERISAAEALGKLGTPPSARALTATLEDRDSRVRTAVCKALGGFRGDAEVAEALRRVVRSDEADAPVGAALASLGQVAGHRALEVFREALGRESDREVIRVGALKGLAELQGKEAWNLAVQWTAPGKPHRARVAAVKALAGIIPPASVNILEVLEPLSRDHWLFVRQESATTAGRLGLEDARPLLERLADTDLSARVRQAARRSLVALRLGTPGAERVGELEEEIHRLRRETRRLNMELDSLKDTKSTP